MTTAIGTYHISSLAEAPHQWNEGAARLGRLIIHKSFTGDIVGTSVCEVLFFSTDKELPIMSRGLSRSGSYVALERFTGTVLGRPGSFVFEHGGSQGGVDPHPYGRILRGSGTGELNSLNGEVLYPHDPKTPGRIELRLSIADEGERSVDDGESGPSELNSLRDREEIRALLFRYSWALDLGQVQHVVSCFTPDCVYQGMAGCWRGWSGIAEMAEMVRGSARTQTVQHWPANSLFEPTPDGYRVMSMVMGPRSGEAPGVSFVGYYLDTLVRRSGAWRFQERIYHVWDDTKKGLPLEWLQRLETNLNIY